MNFREAFRAARPPAPETANLTRLRRWAAGLCFAAALLIIVLRSVGALSIVFLAAVVLMSFAAIVATALLFKRKAQREAEYWTDERPQPRSIEQISRELRAKERQL